MKSSLLVATSVHQPDDPRIRERLIRTLVADFDVTYAAPTPGPSDTAGIEVELLRGARTQRRREVRRLLLCDDYDIAVVHDPELLPAAIAATRRGRIVVFDLHEDVPAQTLARRSIPTVLRRPMASAVGAYLRHAERKVPFTLAESVYTRVLRNEHPVFPNYPRYETFPPPSGDPDGAVVYVGDVTEVRGILTLVEAMAPLASRRRLTVVGRCSPELQRQIEDRAESLGIRVELPGWMPHRDAMAVIGKAAVGVSPLHDLPNYRHSLPTKTIEYLAMGVPTVATDLPGTRKVIGDLPGTILVAPADVEALGLGIQRALAPSARNAALSSAPRIRETYAWPTSAVRDFYRSLLP